MPKDLSWLVHRLPGVCCHGEVAGQLLAVASCLSYR